MVETHCLAQFWSFMLEKKIPTSTKIEWHHSEIHTVSNHQTLPLGADIFQAPDTSTEI